MKTKLFLCVVMASVAMTMNIQASTHIRCTLANETQFGNERTLSKDSKERLQRITFDYNLDAQKRNISVTEVFYVANYSWDEMQLPTSALKFEEWEFSANLPNRTLSVSRKKDGVGARLGSSTDTPISWGVQALGLAPNGGSVDADCTNCTASPRDPSCR
jgi:hypothetical protein